MCWLDWRIATSIAVLLIPFPSTQTCGQEEALKETLVALQAEWRKWSQHELQGEVLRRTTNKGSSVVGPRDDEFTMLADEGRIRTSYRDHLVSQAVTYFVVNPEYLFEVRSQPDDGESYVLTKYNKRSALLAGQKLDIEDRLNRRWGPGIVFVSQRWDTTVNSKGFRATRVEPGQWDGREAVRLEFEYDPTLHQGPIMPKGTVPAAYFELRDGVVTLLPSSSWAPVQWSFSARSPNEKTYTQVRGVAEYDFSTRPFPLIAKIVQTRVCDGVEDVETTTYEYRNLDKPVASERFLLSDFGLDERGMRLPRRYHPAWLVLVIGAMGLCALGIWAVRRGSRN